MTESAIPRRGRSATEQRIALAAQVLADERGGLDAFTMDELADAAGVSRRALFNYFPSKVDAVLGPELCIPDEAIARFQRGEPTGDIVDDLQALVLAVFAEKELDAAAFARFKRLVHANPVLLGTVKERMHRHAELFAQAAAERAGDALSPWDARVAIAVLAGAADVAITEFIDHPDTPVADLYADAIAAVRRLFG